ncbi:unnamed protein product [Spirodela intermedia]|uniref:Uncharacterized protein n=1 Tax=Spirodela intermedia TaxID=51605 RepID=A0A7I8JP99_SPIIN|nr:unnamed protein product [Spirodela intermedia]CAA6671591.1 unnamed protein product [Spirodela intermedia]
MMRNSIATYKESLSRIASDVQEAADELEVLAPRDGEDTLFSDRRISHRFAQSTSPSASPPANGINSGSRAEVELHKAEIQRLRTSETEIKTLAINYAAMLKEKEISNFVDEQGDARENLQLESTLMTTRKERDKTLKELTRLKQHLLDKELEESDKMDEDSRLIEELRASIATQRAHILKLEKALNQENAKNEEAQRTKNDELRQANEIINGLKQKIANYANILESRNAELQNLQTALGQYYAEAEAKERLEGDVVAARAESARLSELLKVANEKLERLEAEKEEVVSKLTQAERTSSDGKLAVQRLQEENLRLRRTLEQSMTRINRMSLDSDYSVDRRIVIKLLLTYFERNHGKEVLDLMVRMLGFSEEEKQRIVAAQQAAGKGVVRGVLGFPGRLVGGILGGGSRESSSALSENQSFADLWVDFLLKETEEREKRELAESTGALAGGSPGNSATPFVLIRAPPSPTPSSPRFLSHRRSTHLNIPARFPDLRRDIEARLYRGVIAFVCNYSPIRPIY